MNKRFSLENRLVFEEGSPEDLREKAGRVNEHEITAEKMRDAVIGELQKLCAKEMRAAIAELASDPDGKQMINVYQYSISVSNKALVELQSGNLKNEFIKSSLWKKIVEARPAIDHRAETLVSLMSLYKVDGANLVPKDSVWMKLLKDGLAGEDGAEVRELEDAWNGTAQDQREAFRKEMELTRTGAVEKHNEKVERAAIAEGEVTPQQIEKLGTLAEKYKASKITKIIWTNYDRIQKEQVLGDGNLAPLLNIEDIKTTKFMMDWEESRDVSSYDTTDEQVEVYKKTVKFAGEKLGFDGQGISNLQKKMTIETVGAMEPKPYIESTDTIFYSVVNLRQFAAGAHVYQKILTDMAGDQFTDSQAFFREFYNRNGSIKKASGKGLDKYIGHLGLKDALTKIEYDNMFVICQPALNVQYDLWVAREGREEDEEREKQAAGNETGQRGAKDSVVETPEESPDATKAKAEKLAREEAERKKLEEDAKRQKEEEAAKLKTEGEARAATSAKLKEKAAGAKSRIENYRQTVDPYVTAFEDLKPWPDLQADTTDELIAETNDTDTFRELKDAYISKTIAIYVRDLQKLSKEGFVAKTRNDKIFAETAQQTITTLGVTKTTPAKSTYREGIAFIECLKQIGLSGESRYYAQEKDKREELLTPITNLFAPFRTEDENKDTPPEVITDAMFESFKSGGIAIASAGAKRETGSQVAETAKKALKDDTNFTIPIQTAWVSLKAGNIKLAAENYEKALKYVKENYKVEGDDRNKNDYSK